MFSGEEVRFDWHRGMDLATPCGTPVFALADGLVTSAGLNRNYVDPMVRVQHGDDSCSGGCFHSEYQHLAGVEVEAGARVQRGQLIGWSGFPTVGKAWRVGLSHEDICSTLGERREQLHLEVRESPEDEPRSRWMRDAIHPMSVLPYPEHGADGMEVEVVLLDLFTRGRPKVEVVARHPGPFFDIARVEVVVYEVRGGRARRVVQPGDAPGALGYLQHPPWLDFEIWNRAWTHKDSPQRSWSSFDDCPYAREHPQVYDPHIHLDQTGGDDLIGSFDRVVMEPSTLGDQGYELRLRFEELVGPLDANRTCVVAWAEDVHGNRSRAQGVGVCP